MHQKFNQDQSIHSRDIAYQNQQQTERPKINGNEQIKVTNLNPS